SRAMLTGLRARDHLDLDGRGDVVVQAHRDLVRAERLDRVADLDLATVDRRPARRGDGLGDVGGGDGAEQATRLARADLHDHRLGLQRVTRGAGLLDRGDLALAARALDGVARLLGPLGIGRASWRW